LLQASAYFGAIERLQAKAPADGEPVHGTGADVLSSL
jgi:hypothetical protein